MDIIFNCPHCDQELEVDESGVGSQIECPSCGKPLTVPEATEENTASSTEPDSTQEPEEDEKTPAPTPAAKPATPAPAHGGPASGKNPLPKPGSVKPGSGPVLPPPKPAAPPPPPKESEKHFVVPVHETPAAVLITKSAKPLEFAAKESDKKMRIKTFKRTDCQEVGHDHFDEIVSAFLDKVGQANIVSINTINYSTLDLGSHNLMNDYGVLIVFRG
jgi:hypothetical protein